MARISRRAAIRAFYDEQRGKPAVEALRKRRLRDEQDRERRLIKAMEAFAGLGCIAVDRTRIH